MKGREREEAGAAKRLTKELVQRKRPFEFYFNRRSIIDILMMGRGGGALRNTEIEMGMPGW